MVKEGEWRYHNGELERIGSVKDKNKVIGSILRMGVKGLVLTRTVSEKVSGSGITVMESYGNCFYKDGKQEGEFKAYHEMESYDWFSNMVKNKVSGKFRKS